MAFGYDNTSVKFQFPFRAAKDTARGFSDISRLADYAGDSQLSGICKRQFNLGFLTEGPQDGHVFKRPSGSFDCETFPAKILARLT